MYSSPNVIKEVGYITKQERQELNGYKPMLIWLTGLSGSGKSTIAKLLEKKLILRQINAYVLDGDNIRHGLNKDLDFTPESRQENIRRIGEVGKLFVDAGVFSISAFISPYKEDRNKVRELFKDKEFIEVFVDCPVEVCETRDVKGLYKKARDGEIKNFTGISAPYEAPAKPEVTVNTNNETPSESVQKIISYLEKHKFIQ